MRSRWQTCNRNEAMIQYWIYRVNGFQHIEQEIEKVQKGLAPMKYAIAFGTTV